MIISKKILARLFLVFKISFIFVVLSWPIKNAFSQPNPLPPEVAFKFSGAHIQNKSIVTTWVVAPSYYLYHDKFHFSIAQPSSVKLGLPLFPKTYFYKEYPTGEKMKTYTGQFNIILPVEFSQPPTKPIKLLVRYQGCSELGICYPEQSRTALVSLSGVKPTIISSSLPPRQDLEDSTQNQIMHLLQDKTFFSVIGAFFILGLLLSLTPCVLPMIPILSSIILGQKHLSHARSFFLSLVYVLAMALTYAVLGIIVGLIGARTQAFLQNPWIIGIFALIFILMALSLFGFFNLQLPESLRSRVAEISNHQKHGSWIGTAVMGCLSTLILSPCVTPPLAGAIIYIGDKGNALLGASALFFMGIGMGVPLLIIGASSAKLLPKAGRWMNIIKALLGVLMLGMAIWLLSRLLPGQITMWLWALLAIGSAVALRTFSSSSTRTELVGKFIGIILFIYGIILLLGGLQGQTNPLKPLSYTQSQPQNNLVFIPIQSVAQLDMQLQNAKSLNKPVILDFYASWCLSCRTMDSFVFTNPKVKQLMQEFVLLRVDVTQDTAESRALEKALGVVAPPTILFYDSEGKELKSARIVGEISANSLISHLTAILSTRE